MNLYLISQNVDAYDIYTSAVVCAKNETDARMIHPSKYVENWDGVSNERGDWCKAKDVQVKLIGEAVLGTKRGVIHAAYRRG